MFRIFIKKLNKQSKHRRLAVTGTACLVIATVLILSMLSQGGLDSQARGYAYVEDGNTDGTFWYGFTIPDEVKIWQKLTVKPTVTSKGELEGKTYEINGSDTAYKTSIDVSYAREDQFCLNISENILVSDCDAWGADLRTVDTEKVWKDSSDTDCSFSWSPSYVANYQKTYYRIVGQGETVGTDWGEKLFKYYQDNYETGTGSSYGLEWKKDSNAIVTNKDTCGRDFQNLADTFLSTNGFMQYTSREQIPMTQNGKVIAGVEMLTYTSRDLYYNVVRSGSSRRVDLDVMVYTTHSYEFNYGNTKPVMLGAPKVSKENGISLTSQTAASVSKDDRILLSNDGVENAEHAVLQYYLSDSKVTDTTKITGWKNYTAKIDPAGKKYLYVRNNYKNGTGCYLESTPEQYELKYLDTSSAFVAADPKTGSSIDVDDKITLSAKQSGSGSPVIYYVAHASKAPELTAVSAETYTKLSGSSGYAQLDGSVYIQLNGLWYQSDDAQLQKYTGQISPGDELRKNHTLIIYALVAEEGKELGEFQKFQYSYSISKQTETPKAAVQSASVNTGTITMGTAIELTCATEGSRIFYATNGSAPVITQDPDTGEPVAGANTKEYDPKDMVVVSEENAEYGRTFQLMAQAVTYTKTGDMYYRESLDSTVARFTYTVANQSAVEAVQSIPKTDASAPVEVTVGSAIQLYSQTDNVTIYYTLDGSEPTFDENGPTTEATKVYSGTEGVVVTKLENSSLFTVTAVAYKKGLAVSDISRLVFSYPGAVSSPYANPLPGAVEDNTQVTLQTATKDAVIYYEIARGSEVPKDPTTASKVFDEASPIVITEKTTIKAVAVKDSMESSIVTLSYTVSDKLKTPEASIETGAVLASGTVVSLKADSGATIYYTLDGSDPKDSTNKKVQVGSQVIISGKSGDLILLRTYAVKQGYSSSEEGTYSYSVSAYAGGIYADRENGSAVKNADTVYLHTDLTDADIYYTLDGSVPTTDSHKGSSVTVYGEPGEQVTIMAVAVADGSENSTSFATFTYTIMGKVAAPTSSVPDGAVFTKQSAVELQAESGKIYYTTDGTDPTTGSNLYKKNIIITEAVTIRAIAVAKDLETSEISTFHYGFADQVAAPVASYASGELEMGTKVSFTTATEGATIYYRTDGKDINLSKKNELEIYKEPITIDRATNFRVIAVKDQMQDSNVLKVGYTVKEPVVIEAAGEEETQKTGNQSSRLQSRRSFSETESGPSFQDVVLKNASYGAVVAAEEGTLPDQVQLNVESTNVTESVNRRVKQVLSESYGVVASYDVTLLTNGEEIQPDGTIEIGLPIPVEYENAMIYVIHVQDDGNIELYETRRSGGVAYAKVDHLSVYSIAAPVEYEEEESTFPWLFVMYTAAVGLTGLGVFMICRAKKERREDGMEDV